MPKGDLVCAVDVGTGSARAGVFDGSGNMLGRQDHPIAMHQPYPNFAEHSSENIWNAVCAAVKAAVAQAGVERVRIAGIGFGATCSLVMRDKQGEPLSVSPSGDNQWDTVVWLDHRAIEEADACTATGHPVLQTIGGRMSPEMQVPKAMWLKRHLPHQWERCGFLYDLADFLTWKATGSSARSRCTLTCKWTFEPDRASPWHGDFLSAVGLEDFLLCGGLPNTTARPGDPLGTLTDAAAEALGLSSDCRVGPGLIDAYAGALGVLGQYAGAPDILRTQLALIAGTSSCLMTLSPDPIAIPGGWGPYPGVTLPQSWVTEGGQSATGGLLDHVIRAHGAGGEPTSAMHSRICTRINELHAAEGEAFARRLHVLPDFHGNRTPFADPHALGVISGLSLDASFDGLCRIYWRAAVAIALGTRQILDSLRAAGAAVETLHVAGGHARNPLLPELYADVTGREVIVHHDGDAMLAGSAMCAAAAAGLHGSLERACIAMGKSGRSQLPKTDVKARFDRDYAIFLQMQRHRTAIEALDP
ncbi:FGGY-family carbohydrate kinase [Tianweitania sediminis]|uniref:FGGY-family carbohydrate kinase n=1 Tax=Tianweitania sediminis TaxID=1502156 RepID=A0A8J7RKM4_9HYPH|nr:FGGY-family carbohydrate kinase [Tianweitania sediminis]MBP0438981.1 FGGY-family carbohydrate kinase [Tianweitania sediminis]